MAADSSLLARRLVATIVVALSTALMRLRSEGGYSSDGGHQDPATWQVDRLLDEIHILNAVVAEREMRSLTLGLYATPGGAKLSDKVLRDMLMSGRGAFVRME